MSKTFYMLEMISGYEYDDSVYEPKGNSTVPQAFKSQEEAEAYLIENFDYPHGDATDLIRYGIDYYIKENYFHDNYESHTELRKRFGININDFSSTDSLINYLAENNKLAYIYMLSRLTFEQIYKIFSIEVPNE